ncbi:hypothetical protein [Pseudonocardia phyllosphaerae]|uniref:hypothetical protein n=1 Tax=Pseudonocardia phyllosphaerae TaxID=3390502 RepID=UPI00397A2DEB
MSATPAPGAGTRTGRRILAVLLVLATAVHAHQAVVAGDLATTVLDGLVAIGALVALVLILLRGDDARVLLAAAVVGGAGVALFLVPGLITVSRGGMWQAWLDPWAFGALLCDAMTVRIAVFTLRRAG